jgi:hypothetical protein
MVVVGSSEQARSAEVDGGTTPASLATLCCRTSTQAPCMSHNVGLTIFRLSGLMKLCLSLHQAASSRPPRMVCHSLEVRSDDGLELRGRVLKEVDHRVPDGRLPAGASAYGQAV